MTQEAMPSRIIAAVVVVAALAAATAWFATRDPASSEAGGVTHIGGPFTLVDSTGKTITDQDFRGKFMLVYFGYTHCPDACPTTLSDMGAALDKLPTADRAKIVPLFITIDPERDTPGLIGDYAHAFGPEFVGLTGSKNAITAAEQEYHVYAVRHPLEHGDYAMDHSSIIYVMGPDGKFLGLIEDAAKPGDMAQRLVAFGV
jgi:cytochrome oxidase Cu insertion factor (SCO1/SenC/PrrC family)